jgi:hypothetical protein
MFHDAFLLGRAAGLDSGVGDQCAILCDTGVLLVADGVLIEVVTNGSAIS